MFWPLLAYAAATLVASFFSVDPETSFRDCKQLLLFAIVPIAYRLLRGERSLTAVDVIITVGALNAVYGIVQYRHPELRQHPAADPGQPRPLHDVLGRHHAGRLHRRRARDVPPPRSRLGGARPAGGARRAGADAQPQRVGRRLRRHRRAVPDEGLPPMFRMAALLPVLLGIGIALAPTAVTERFYSMLSLEQVLGESETTGATVQSNRDRLAMIRSGLHIIRDKPLTGVGPDMLIQVYPHYRDSCAVRQLNPHLHNVPLQIAAERGLPALAIWLLVRRDAAARFHPPAPGVGPALARRRRPRLRHRDAGGRHVRIQFRRLRVPDAVSRSRDAAVRRRTTGRLPPRPGREPPRRRPYLHAHASRAVLDRLSGRAVLVDRRPDGRSVRDRQRRSHFAGSAGADRAIRPRDLAARRRRQRRQQHRRARRSSSKPSASSAPTPTRRGCSQEMVDPVDRHVRHRQPTRRGARRASCGW